MVYCNWTTEYHQLDGTGSLLPMSGTKYAPTKY